MKFKLLLPLLFMGLLSSCQKDMDSKSNIEFESINSSISLEKAIELKKSKEIANSPIAAIKTLNPSNQKSVQQQNSPFCPAFPTEARLNSSFNILLTGNNNHDGAGRFIKYKFKKGRTYQIKFSQSLVNSFHDNDEKITNFPSLQIGLSNHNSYPVGCLNYLDLNLYDLPYMNVPAVPGQNRYDGPENSEKIARHSRTITLTADECYEHLWFNGVPSAGTYKVSIGISGLSITEVGEDFQLHQTGSFESGGSATFKVGYNSFYIDHPFEWTTTGNLIIEGSNVGSTVKVKSTNPATYNGTVIASIPGCGKFAEKSFDRCALQFNSATINGPNSVLWGREYNISINVPQEHQDKEIDVLIENNNNRATLTKVSKFQYKMTTEVLQRTPGMPDLGPPFLFRARFTNSCGNHEFVRKTIQAVNSTKPIVGVGG